jgi:hypothetical protein
MSVFEAFNEFQDQVNADPAQVALARERRRVFKDALLTAEGVAEVVGSGSLERSTQLKPIHDVDLIVIYNQDAQPLWGQPGNSSMDALEHVRGVVNGLLGATNGTFDQLVRLAKPRNRAVKCFVDDPQAQDAFTVDVMPALRTTAGTLMLPSVLDEAWSEADPEYLIKGVQARHDAWAEFRPMVRALKEWRLDTGVTVKSLVMEVLAYHFLPLGPNRPEALRAFFTAAAAKVNEGVDDPAGFCGEIQPDLDYEALSTSLSEAADQATLAVAAVAAGDQEGAQRHWQRVFGSDFPAPPATNGAPASAAVGSSIKDAPQGAL